MARWRSTADGVRVDRSGKDTFAVPSKAYPHGPDLLVLPFRKRSGGVTWVACLPCLELSPCRLC
jgi:hypothetical protein